MKLKRGPVSSWRQSAVLFLTISALLCIGLFFVEHTTKQGLVIAEQERAIDGLIDHFEDVQIHSDDAISRFVRRRQQKDLLDWAASALNAGVMDRVEAGLQASGASPVELAQLEAIRPANSDVTAMQTHAARLITLSTGTQLSVIPPEVLNFLVPTGNLNSLNKMGAARNILFSRDYQNSVSKVRLQVEELRTHIEKRFNVEEARINSWRVIALSFLSIVVFGVALSLLLELFRRRQMESRIQAYIKLGESLSGVSTAAKAAELIVDAAEILIGWDACYVALYDPKTRMLDFIASYEMTDGERRRIDSLKTIAGEHSRRVIEEKTGILHNQDPRESLENTMIFGENRRPALSLMYVPIRKKSEVIGLISLQSSRPRAYNKESLSNLQWLADRCAAGLERATLYDLMRQSEERYRLLLENSIDGVYVIGRDRINYCNAAFASIFGYESPDDITGKISPVGLLCPADKPVAACNIEKVINGEPHEQRIKYRALRQSGDEILIETQCTRIQFDGNPAVLGTLRDISERERAEKAIQEAHAIYHAAIESMGAIPYTLDYETHAYNFFGSDIEKLTGYTADELDNQLLASRVRESEYHGELKQFDYDERVRRARSGQFRNMRLDMKIERKDGRMVWIADASIPRRDEQGNIVGSLGIMLDITERKRGEQRVRAFASLGDKLNSVSSAIEAAKVVAATGEQLFGYDACNITMYEHNSEKLYALLSEDIVDGIRKAVVAGEHQEMVSPFARSVIEEGAQLLLREPEIDCSPQLLPFGSNRRSASLMFAPLKKAEHAVGYLSFQSYRYNAYTEQDLADLQALADHCAAGLERARLYEMLRASEERFRTVWEKAGSGMRLTDSEGIIRMVNPAFCDLAGLDEKNLIGNPLDVNYASKTDSSHVIDQYTMRFATRMVEPNIERTMEFHDGRQITINIMNAFVNTADGEMLLSIFHDRTKEKQLELELKESAKQLESLATTDSLTGLQNRRSFMEYYSREFARAHRYGSGLSVIMMDLDHFKSVNDTYGHVTGDAVLSRTGEIIMRSLRITDMACRFGGEEFCIFMPETDLEGAVIFAERLREEISVQSFHSNTGRFSVSCSVGVAQLAAECEDPILFLSVADRELYRAKQDGRNRVCATDRAPTNS
jgi:diguanylate cyclase (GGDEF)-like protein/PAS domain S-box-containing protein